MYKITSPVRPVGVLGSPSATQVGTTILGVGAALGIVALLVRSGGGKERGHLHGRRRSLGESHGSRELSLFIANDQQLYNQEQAIRGAIGKKFCKNAYSHTLAEKGFKHVVDAGARKYAKEFGGQARNIFTATDRKEVAAELAASFREDINLCITKPGGGWCDNLPKPIAQCAIGRAATGQGALAGRRGAKKRRK